MRVSMFDSKISGILGASVLGARIDLARGFFVDGFCLIALSAIAAKNSSNCLNQDSVAC